MRVITDSDTLTVYPVGYDEDNHSYYSVSGMTQGEDGSDSTNYATINLARGSSAETYVYWIFGAMDIPSGATISSISCSVKCYISTTSSSYLSARQAQLFTGTTAKGSASNISNSTSAFNLSCGSWTADEIANIRLRIYARRASRNTNSNYYFRFYGATLTVTYTYNGYAYTITSESQLDGVSTSPATQELLQGEDAEITITGDISNGKVTDNETDVTSSLVAHSGASVSAIPESQTHSGLDGGTSYANYAVGHSAEDPNDSSGNMYAGSGSTGYVDYDFDFSEIPVGSTITSMEVKVYGKRESSSNDSSHMAKIGLYSGSTLKSTEQQFTSTSLQTITINDPGTWTRAELQSAKLRFTVAYYGGAVSGITWNVTYQAETYYTYTITNLDADHTVLVALSQMMYVKQGGAWVPVKKVYKKIGGVWVEQSDLTNLLDTNLLLVKGDA